MLIPNSPINSGFILIVDDNPTNLSVLAQILNQADLSIRIATDGESALELLAEDHELPALIILDVQMPGIDGFETCYRLKSNPITYDIPVIFMTAASDVTSKVKGLSLGAVDYITKPFESEEVLARVRIHLQIQQLTKKQQQWNQELEQKLAEHINVLQKTQVQLVQQEKFAAMGQLIAGVAHEINNPITCIVNNIPPAYEYVKNLIAVIQLYQQYYSQPVPEIQTALEELDIEFASDDLFKLLNSMKLSSERIQDISVSLRNFYRSDISTKIAVNLHECLDSTLLILRHRLKALGDRPAIEVLKEYGELPKIYCYPGLLNQVFMNLIANAIDAVEEVQHPQIRIFTQVIGSQVLITIADNGVGMTEEMTHKLFQPLFTTKPFGKGTGLGLSIARQIIDEKHHGQLKVSSEYGKGSEFIIFLPLS
ncbi:response regulator receiver sensor signal transduction histidine kinase [Nostoc sp. NIES-3756]|uniref:sensor histidine kinase n=1 Tax=Nostoc sp. NIES-3756 TaxID=1751286 RepID=UPI000720ADB6|nr:response regulator [Nostoc sp. NIES-3756]BAT52936.1 response regulator receiver sensor signal transduction histidine kinase [Nostoc sp. NIES-3756]